MFNIWVNFFNVNGWFEHITFTIFIRALALISDLVYGEPASWKDPVKYSFTHGGKDGFPYPVDKETYDNSIETIRDAIEQARLKKDDKLKAIRRLDDFIS